MKGWVRFFLEKIMKSPEKKVAGCKNCRVGTYYGLQPDGYFTAHCRSAHLGLDDKLSYITRSVRLKISEEYPDWCPIYGKIK